MSSLDRLEISFTGIALKLCVGQSLTGPEQRCAQRSLQKLEAQAERQTPQDQVARDLLKKKMAGETLSPGLPETRAELKRDSSSWKNRGPSELDCRPSCAR